MSRNFIREKKIFCSDTYMEVDIYPYTDIERKKGKRSKKKKESEPKQKNLNDKNAKRYLIQKIHANFKDNDLYITLTYTNSSLPENIQEGEKNIQNYIRRLKRARKKAGLDELKYIAVTEHSEDEDTGKIVRIHHHLIINSGLNRDEVEELWRKKRTKGESQGKKIGFVNANRIQEDENTGLTSLAKYLSKDPRGKKRWTCSKNLVNPTSRTNDYKYTRKKIISLATNHVDISYWERKYPGWTIKDKIGGYEAVYNDFTGWSIYLKLRKKE